MHKGRYYDRQIEGLSLIHIFMLVVLGIVAVVFITMDYLVPAVVVAGILLVQPVILILISNMLEKKM